jgi:hypothetical protein
MVGSKRLQLRRRRSCGKLCSRCSQTRGLQIHRQPHTVFLGNFALLVTGTTWLAAMLCCHVLNNSWCGGFPSADNEGQSCFSVGSVPPAVVPYKSTSQAELLQSGELQETLHEMLADLLAESGVLTPRQEAAHIQLAPSASSSADLDAQIAQLAVQMAGLQGQKDAQLRGVTAPVLDAEATIWLHSCGFGELERVLGDVGSNLADLAMMSAEDVDALQLKKLTRERLRYHLAKLDGSRCMAAPRTAVVGQQLSEAIDQQLSF